MLNGVVYKWREAYLDNFCHFSKLFLKDFVTINLIVNQSSAPPPKVVIVDEPTQSVPGIVTFIN